MESASASLNPSKSCPPYDNTLESLASPLSMISIFLKTKREKKKSKKNVSKGGRVFLLIGINIRYVYFFRKK